VEGAFLLCTKKGFADSLAPQNQLGLPSHDWLQRLSRDYGLNPNRKVAARAKVRTVAESEAAVKCFFNGTSETRDTPTGTILFDLPGYLHTVNQVWSTGSDGQERRYKDHPERMASFDEAALGGTAAPKGVAPKRARHVAVVQASPGKSITVFCGCTFAGEHLPDHFILEGITFKENLLAMAPPESRLWARPDGYMMTQEVWEAMLTVLASQIRGEKRRRS
jgi:hypothetical protein